MNIYKAQKEHSHWNPENHTPPVSLLLWYFFIHLVSRLVSEWVRLTFVKIVYPAAIQFLFNLNNTTSIIFTAVVFVVQDVSNIKEEISAQRTTTAYLKITTVLSDTVQCTHEAEREYKDN